MSHHTFQVFAPGSSVAIQSPPRPASPAHPHEPPGTHLPGKLDSLEWDVYRQVASSAAQPCQHALCRARRQAGQQAACVGRHGAGAWRQRQWQPGLRSGAVPPGIRDSQSRRRFVDGCRAESQIRRRALRGAQGCLDRLLGREEGCTIQGTAPFTNTTVATQAF